MSQEKVAELAAHVASEKDKQLASLASHVEQLELALGQKEEVGDPREELKCGVGGGGRRRRWRRGSTSACIWKELERRCDGGGGG